MCLNWANCDLPETFEPRTALTESAPIYSSSVDANCILCCHCMATSHVGIEKREREGGGNKDWEERFLFLPPPHWKSFVLAGVESCLLFPPLSCFFHIWSPLAFFSVPISIIGLLHPVNKACRQSKLLLEKYHRHGSFTSKNCEKASKVSSKIDGVAQLLQLTSQ